MFALSTLTTTLYVLIGFVSLCLLIGLLFLIQFVAIWVQAFMSNAQVSFLSLIGMRLRRVKPRLIVTAKIMGVQAGLDTNRTSGISTENLEAHVLAGGDVMRVVRAIIAARQAGMDLEFDRAAAIDLAGRDVLDAVQTSVLPKVIDCPEPGSRNKTWLSAIARDGIELRVHVRVTVRTCLDRLVGGATEQTIIARVGHGVISAIGSADDYASVMSAPDQISTNVISRSLDSNTAFEVVSIDIAEIDVGENIGARLQTEQAEADTRMARAVAESRRAAAIATAQEMSAEVARSQANYIFAESKVPLALAAAFRAGHFSTSKNNRTFPKLHRPAG